MNKTLKFNEKYFETISEGFKTQTTRLYPKDIDMYDIVIAEFTNGKKLKIYIRNAWEKPFKHLTQKDAEREGFHNVHELKDELKRIYPQITDNSTVYIYIFKLWGRITNE